MELSVLSCFDLVFSDQDTAGLTLPQATLPQPLAKVDRQYRRVFKTGSKHGNMDQDTTPWNGLRVYATESPRTMMPQPCRCRGGAAWAAALPLATGQREWREEGKELLLSVLDAARSSYDPYDDTGMKKGS